MLLRAVVAIATLDSTREALVSRRGRFPPR
jgi:hypothetical protein